MSVSEYDLIVIGSGPAGQKGAIAAAKAHKRVAVIDRTTMIGGVCVHTGTIPSKTVREAIFQLTGFVVKALYGNGSRKRGDISLQDVSFRVHAIISRETEVIRAQLKRNSIAIYEGRARFLDPHTLEVQSDDGGTKLTYREGSHCLRHSTSTQPGNPIRRPSNCGRRPPFRSGWPAEGGHRCGCRSRGLRVRIVLSGLGR